MTSDVQKTKVILEKLYEKNAFVRLLDMNITEIREGAVEISMPVSADKHANLYSVLHGGAAASLADTAMGIACATLGRKVVTVEMNINFIKSAEIGQIVRAIGSVIHCGQQTLVVDCDLWDGTDVRIAKARGTFMTIGWLEDVQHG